MAREPSVGPARVLPLPAAGCRDLLHYMAACLLARGSLAGEDLGRHGRYLELEVDAVERGPEMRAR